MAQYLDHFMVELNNVLRSPDYPTEAKTHAFTAVSEICLNVEGNFWPHLQEIMENLLAAGQVTVQ